MAPPSLDFFPLVFGLFKVGAVLVMIDPGIARRALLSCLEEVQAEAFIGVPRAHLARLLFPRPFRSVRANVTVGRRLGWGGHTLRAVERLGQGAKHEMVAPAKDETAAILFTSGSTGVPKGVVYTHEMFDAQVRCIRATYGIAPGEVDLPTFPLFALFDPALGMTAVLPDMDFRFPARADPVKLVLAATTHRCTNMFGSPALLDRLGRHGVAAGVKLPHLRRVLSAGAPVRTDVLERMSKMLSPDAQVFTPFGATESLPVASIGSHEVLSDTARGAATGRGVCVGRPVLGSLVRIIRITDDAIPEWSDDLEVPVGTIGEITVRGPVVTHEYHARPEATRLAKIREGDAIVHRMGDVGAMDDSGRLWMCGRKSHRVETPKGRSSPSPSRRCSTRTPPSVAPRSSGSDRAGRTPGPPHRARARRIRPRRGAGEGGRHAGAAARGDPRAADLPCLPGDVSGRHAPRRQDRRRDARSLGGDPCRLEVDGVGQPARRARHRSTRTRRACLVERAQTPVCRT